jgi:hypothetical protein
MKTPLSIIALVAVTLSAGAATFYQFGRLTTNAEPFQANPIFNTMTASNAATADSMVARSISSTNNMTASSTGGGVTPFTINLFSPGTNRLATIINTVNGRSVVINSNADISIGAGIYSGDGSGLTNLPSSGSYAGPTLTTTNLISGRPYTNSTGRPQMVIQGVVLTTAIVSGAAEMSFYMDVTGGISWTSTNRVTDGTTALTQSDQNVRQLTGFVPIGASYVITNTSRGGGNSASLDLNQTTGLLITY